MSEQTLCRVIFFQGAQLDAAVDQSTNNAENGRVFGQLMAKSLCKNLEFVQLRHGVFNHNTIFVKKTVICFLLFGSGWLRPALNGSYSFLSG